MAFGFQVSGKNDRTEGYGWRGELRAGGRVAARLGAYHYKATPGGWAVVAGLHAPEDYLIDHGAEFELRLLFGPVGSQYLFVGPAPGDVLTVTRKPGASTELVVIVGTQKLEKIERYGSGRKTTSQQHGLYSARAYRDIPGASGSYDPSRGRIMVRVGRDDHAPVRRGPLG